MSRDEILARPRNTAVLPIAAVAHIAGKVSMFVMVAILDGSRRATQELSSLLKSSTRVSVAVASNSNWTT